MHEGVAKKAKEKKEKKDEVVEVEWEEMVEEKVKEGKVKDEVPEKVLEEEATGAGQLLRSVLGGWTGGIMDLPWDPAVLAGPHPPNLDHPLLVPPRESDLDSPSFDALCASQNFRAGEVAVGARGGDPLGQTPAGGGGGGVAGAWWW